MFRKRIDTILYKIHRQFHQFDNMLSKKKKKKYHN